MFDPKKYSTRMRDPDGKRKKPPVEERSHDIPTEATLRTRTTERFDEKRAEQPLQKREAATQGRLPASRPRKSRPKPGRRPGSNSPGVAGRAARPNSAPTWTVFTAISIAGLAVSLMTRACPNDPPRTRAISYQRPHPTRPAPEPRRMGRRAPEADPVSWRSRLPARAADRISGAVLFGSDQAMPYVQLVLTQPEGPAIPGETDEYGIFVFDHVASPTASLEARGTAHLGASGRDTRQLRNGTRGATLQVHRQHAISLHLARGRRMPWSGDGVLQVAATNGDLRGEGSWALERRVALVTGLEPLAFYDLLVQAPDSEQACLLERVASGEQLVVTLGPATTIHGRVLLPDGASTGGVEVVLTRGQLRIPARMTKYGWQADVVPLDSWWDVTARRKGHAGTREATRTGVHAGEGLPIILDLR